MVYQGMMTDLTFEEGLRDFSLHIDNTSSSCAKHVGYRHFYCFYSHKKEYLSTWYHAR